MHKVVLLRHCESTWKEEGENLFCLTLISISR
jgi:bisphosphoglycerate-dependent phosphoglycerate mutase